MSSDTSREDTVEHIDPTSDPLYEILWCPNSHQIVRLGLWKMRCKHIEDPIHILLGLPYRETSDRDSWSIERLHELS